MKRTFDNYGKNKAWPLVFVSCWNIVRKGAFGFSGFRLLITRLAKGNALQFGQLDGGCQYRQAYR